MSEPLLELRGIVKTFPGVAALQLVDFDLSPGEVHALLGENGAGKSTLIKVMTGVHAADAGEILLGGMRIHPRSPSDAVNLGISTVYQEVNLAPNLSIAENVCLGREARGALGIRWSDLRRRAEVALDRLGLKLDVRLPLGSVSIALQQMVAIARALDVSAKVLVLDEPTSSLDANEVAQLFGVVRSLKDQGLGIVFVTHFLDQVYQLSDRITVLRNGHKVGTWLADGLSRLELVTNMIGRDASELDRTDEAAAGVAASGEPVVSARQIGTRHGVSDVTFDIRPGEVLGLAGLLGSGRTETLRMVFGLDKPDMGKIERSGVPIRRFDPKQSIREGFALCAEDRKREGIFPDLSVRENIILVLQAKRGWLRKLSYRSQSALAGDLASRLRIHPPDLEGSIDRLSGGNQQKALIARWLAVEPALLMLDEPTRGIDVGAKFEIMSLVEQLRQDGGAVIFVSSELPEVVRTSTKVLVLRDRKAVGMLEGAQVSEQQVVREIAEGGA